MSDLSREDPADFLAQKAYPAEPASPASPARPVRSRTVQNLLAGLIFVVIVGVVTYLRVISTSGKENTAASADRGLDKKTAAAIKFAIDQRAVWDPEDTYYILETEHGQEGHFDFPFENVSDGPAEIGLGYRSCDCSHLEVCIVPPGEWQRYRDEIVKNPTAAKAGAWQWESIEGSDTKGFDVAPGAKGLVRVVWNGRKGPGSRLKLSIRVWHQPKGNVSQRNFDDLEVPIVMAAPFLFTPARGDVGPLGPRDTASAEFTLWSATRPDLELQWVDSDDPRFVYESKAFTPEECRELEKKLNLEQKLNADKKSSTRVRKAYHFKVTVHEQAAGKQLDQGPFYHAVTFLLDDDKVKGPQVQGAAQGDVLVGNAKDRGKVDFEIFRAREGTERIVSLWTNNQMILEPDSQTPATLDVKLTKGDRSGARTKWLLKVTVPRNTHFGVFPEESVIILRTKTNPPRFIRIPVTGNGQS